MSHRLDEWSERIGALVLAVVGVVVFWVARAGIAGAHGAIDRREELLAAWVSWNQGPPATRVRAAAPDLVALFGDDVRVHAAVAVVASLPEVR